MDRHVRYVVICKVNELLKKIEEIEKSIHQSAKPNV